MYASWKSKLRNKITSAQPQILSKNQNIQNQNEIYLKNQTVPKSNILTIQK